MKTANLIFLFTIILTINFIKAQTISEVGLYQTFEQSLENNNSYTNKFIDVELNCVYTSPSGKKIEFIGFFDGNGAGEGDSQQGNIWKIRFLPDEIGQWNYTWSWSDSTSGGQDSFICVSNGVGKGIIRPYENNTRWFAYNGTDPVWIKSYYESGHGAISQPFDWITTNVYQPIIDRGYNHLQVNWLLSLCCYDQYYHDGPAQSTTDLTLYQSGHPSGTMRLDVWHMMEQNVAWLNERNIGLHMFLGFDGGRNSGPSWTALSETEKDFYVRYVIARLAPYANIAGWSFVWEVPGDRLTHELGWAQLVKKYDVFDHLRTYQDENPGENEYSRPEYNFAAVENHLMYSTDKEEDRPHWKEAWTHHNACLAGYTTGKPVIMIEGNALWRRYWGAKCGASKDDLRQAAWACATAGASFIWCGHEGVSPLMALGPQGLPFYSDSNEYAISALQIDILSNVMNNEITFYTMQPTDSLLSDHDPHCVWCLSEPGNQYLVFSIGGSLFKLQLAAGQYNSNQWMNSKTGAGQIISPITASDNQIISFSPPDSTSDWILLIRNEWEQKIQSEARIVSAIVDTSGQKVFVNCDKEMNDPANHAVAFKIKASTSNSSYPIGKISLDTTNHKIIIIELTKTVVIDQAMLLSYSGILTATDSSILAPIDELTMENNSVKTGINSMKKIDLSIYPNPCTDHMEVCSNIRIEIIRILDITGKSILELKDIAQTKKLISLSGIPKGVYLLSVTSSSSTIVETLVKN